MGKVSQSFFRKKEPKFFVFRLVVLFFVELNKNNPERTPVFHISKGEPPVAADGGFTAEKRAAEGKEKARYRK